MVFSLTAVSFTPADLPQVVHIGRKLVVHLQAQTDRSAHGLQTPGHTFNIAMLASRADLRATGQRVPGRLGPFNSGVGAHGVAPAPGTWVDRSSNSRRADWLMLLKSGLASHPSCSHPAAGRSIFCARRPIV